MPSEPGWRKRGLPRVGGSVAATQARRPKRAKASQQSYEAFIDLAATDSPTELPPQYHWRL